MISVIVPVFNCEKYLDKCIKSILSQTYKNLEIILINDGSSDKSEEICLRWANEDNRIIYVKKKNEGQGKARNLGVDISNGKYLTFVDSDDWLEEDALEYMHNAAESSSADIITGNINYVSLSERQLYNSFTSVLRLKSNINMNTSMDIDLINKVRLFLWGKLYRRELFVKNNVRQPGHFFEDTVIVPLLTVKANNIYHIDKAVYNYLRNRSDSTVNNIKSLYDMEKSLNEIKEKFEKEGLFKKYYEALKKLSYSQVRFVYKKLSNEDSSESREILTSLYNFMDRNYPEWINIDYYTIGINDDEKLKTAIDNIVFNNSSVKSSPVLHELINRDILVVNLVDRLLSEDKRLWIDKCKEELKYLEENFKGKEIIAVKFIDKNYEIRDKEVINDVYDSYEKSKLNISVLNFHLDEKEFNENTVWDLSDEILMVLQKE